jgi:carbonic anhydrase
MLAGAAAVLLGGWFTATAVTFPGGHLTASEHPGLLAGVTSRPAMAAVSRPPSADDTTLERRGITMTRMTPLLERNEQFASTYTPAPLSLPTAQVLIVTCLDHRVDPAITLGLRLGDAPVIRNAGGRVTQAVIDDLAYLAFLAGQLSGGQDADSRLFEVAVVHHTQCGTGLLADPGFRHQAAEATGLPEASLAAAAVADPHITVKADVERLLTSPLLSPKVSVSGHVYDIATGYLTTTVDARYP